MSHDEEHIDRHPDSAGVRTYRFATLGSHTERGGRVTTATSRTTIAGLPIARIGVASSTVFVVMNESASAVRDGDHA